MDNSVVAVREFAPRTESLDEVLIFVTQYLRSNGCSAHQVLQMEIACEEAFVNICRYAGLEEPQKVQIQVALEAKYVRILFLDSGTPFDPLRMPEADIHSSAQERSIGGLGIHMLRNLTDQVSYRHDQGKNILTLTARIPSSR